MLKQYSFGKMNLQKKLNNKEKTLNKLSGNSNHEIAIFKALETGKALSPSVLIRATVACLVNLDLLSILQ